MRTGPRDVVAAVALVAFLAIPAAARAGSAPDAGVPFEPPPLRDAPYGVQGPDADPRRQTTEVPAPGGVRVHVDTWLPAARDGHEPPARVPTVLLYSPYETPGQLFRSYARFRDALVTRGYAFSVAHVPGTGNSTGCMTFSGAVEQAAGARVVEYLGRDAPWSEGSVGMIGQSASGGTQLAVAGSPERERVRYLRAIVPGSAVGSEYDFFHHDGVPHLLHAAGSTTSDAVNHSLTGTGQPGMERDPAGRVGCRAGVLAATLDTSGDYTAWHRERDRHRDVHRIEAATLLSHGHADVRVSPHVVSGLFDRLPGGTPRAGFFGVWSHERPDTQTFEGTGFRGERRDWERADWLAVNVAWYDRWLMDIDNGVDDWPVAQVQGTDGQWRAEPDWPVVGGPPGQLALGAGGTLGTQRPSGSTSYTEAALELEGRPYPPGTAAVFETAPLPGRLELTGMPVLDAWVRVDRADAHVAAKLEVLDASGRPTLPEARTIGARSLRHLDPMPDGHFVQPRGRPFADGRPVNVRVRLNPTDLVVPSGGRLRLTVAGSVIAFDGLDGVEPGLGALVQGPTMPSLAFARVTLLHDCGHPTVLRFEMPGEGAELLDVREKDEVSEPLGDDSGAPLPPADGGGAATAATCGRAPAPPQL